jgi:hypothetical protein
MVYSVCRAHHQDQLPGCPLGFIFICPALWNRCRLSPRRQALFRICCQRHGRTQLLPRDRCQANPRWLLPLIGTVRRGHPRARRHVVLQASTDVDRRQEQDPSRRWPGCGRCSLLPQPAGALQYLTMTRPDIAFAVHQACLHMHDPRAPHMTLLKHILGTSVA